MEDQVDIYGINQGSECRCVCENERTANQWVSDTMGVVQFLFVVPLTCLHCHYQIKFDVLSQKTGTNGKSHHEAGGLPHSVDHFSMFVIC